jgi:hypothetical protein
MNWKGLLYNSIEKCQLTMKETIIEINSVIAGKLEDKIYSLNYDIKTNLNWETIYFKIDSVLNGRPNNICYSSDGKGNWLEKGKLIKRFSGCVDIDISVTPFTNSLPINRLKLAENKEAKLNDLYIDVLEEIEKTVNQKYKRLSNNKYKYENIPNDFEAVILVDQEGFIIDYPGLFKRIDK